MISRFAWVFKICSQAKNCKYQVKCWKSPVLFRGSSFLNLVAYFNIKMSLIQDLSLISGCFCLLTGQLMILNKLVFTGKGTNTRLLCKYLSFMGILCHYSVVWSWKQVKLLNLHYLYKIQHFNRNMLQKAKPSIK